MQNVGAEVENLAMLDHPYIVKYIESFEDETNLYIVMEYLEHSTELQSKIIQQKKLMDADKSKIECSLFPEDRIRHLM